MMILYEWLIQNWFQTHVYSVEGLVLSVSCAILLSLIVVLFNSSMTLSGSIGGLFHSGCISTSAGGKPSGPMVNTVPRTLAAILLLT